MYDLDMFLITNDCNSTKNFVDFYEITNIHIPESIENLYIDFWKSFDSRAQFLGFMGSLECMEPTITDSLQQYKNITHSTLQIF